MPQRRSFVTSSFSSDLAARLLEEEILPHQYGRLREPLFRAWIALESGQVWLERGRVFCASSSQSNVVYLVNAGRCTCPARHPCFHRFARRLLLRFFALARAVEADLDADWGDSSSYQNDSHSLTLH